MPHFMIVFITDINLLNLSWIIKCLFLRNIESLSIKNAIQIDSRQILNKFLSYFFRETRLHTDNSHEMQAFDSFPTSSDFCRLLITFANSLDTGQARQNIRPYLNPNSLTLRWYS